ncbi:GSCOCG00011973001-RA-CDS [Cotesia congregata]|nr:GSCOCG00011973001-RA-CDS [Cotesia congregata]
MSIKSSALYEHIRKKNILPLPCKDTLMRYIQKLDSAFGFPKAIFDTLKLKGSRMEVYQKRGTLIHNSYSLSEGIALNRKTLKLEGFVDLGEYTPDHLRHTRADHALVFMFQPFQGKLLANF